MSKADLERAPRVIHKDEMDADVWTFEGAEIPNVGLNAVAGRPPEEYGFEPTAFDEIRRGAYDIHERIRDMNVNGVLGSMCFPSMTGFCGQLFSRTPDRELGLRLLRGLQQLAHRRVVRHLPRPLHAARDRADLGPRADGRRGATASPRRAVTRSRSPRTPPSSGYPSFHSDHWDPFLRACEETGTVVCLHIGSSSSISVTVRRRADRRDDHGHAGEPRSCARPT